MKTYSLLVIAAVVIGAGSAYAQSPACPLCEGDPVVMAEEALRDVIPVLVWMEQSSYERGDMVNVYGHVANISPGNTITVLVRDSAGYVVGIAQINVNEDGYFETAFASDMWSRTGLYQVYVQYGAPSRDSKTQFMLMEPEIVPVASACGKSMLEIEDYCIQYGITGGMVDGVSVLQDYNVISFDISPTDSGMLTVMLPTEVIEGIFFVLVNGEESNDAMIDGQIVTVHFDANTEKIEIIGERVIPEFGLMTALVLGTAIVATVVLSSKSGLRIIPRP